MNPKTNMPFSLEVLEAKRVQRLEAKEKLPLPEKMERKAGGQGKKFSPLDFEGRQFGFLTAIGKSEQKSKYGTVWRFKCKCGNEVEKIAHRVFSGNTRSCGCYIPPDRTPLKHGLNGHYFYGQWRNIINRCTNPNDLRWSSYGGRGIGIYQDWKNNPQKFLDYLGPRPSPRHSIDRIDNNKGYEPGNVRWADHKTQQRNTRRNVFIEYKGVKMCIASWAEKIGLKIGTLNSRLRRGWSLERALNP
jgi:hypothetical protein